MPIKKILIWGEFPPNTHTGISISNQLIVNHLLQEKQNTKIIEEYSWNKKSIAKIFHNLSNYIQIIWATIRFKPEIVYFTLPLSTFSLLKVFLPIGFIHLFSKRTRNIGHIHRGDFSEFINRSRLNKVIALFMFRVSSDIIVLSEQFINPVKEIAIKNNIFILHNTSPIEKEKTDQKKEYCKRFLCISNYIPTKGLLDLVNCFSQKELKSFYLEIYGDNYNPTFKQKLNNIKSNNITLNGPLNRENMSKTLNDFDCLILPSWNEGQPIIILEAMSLGIPVIANNIGDISNMLGESYKYVNKNREVVGLKDCIIKFNKANNKKLISEELHYRYMKEYSNMLHKKRTIDIFLK